MTSAWPPSITAATTELVVPRSIPTAFGILQLLSKSLGNPTGLQLTCVWRLAGITRGAAQSACAVGVRSDASRFKRRGSIAAPGGLPSLSVIDVPGPQPLEDEELRRALVKEAGWKLHDGALVRELMMRDFEHAIRVLEEVAGCAVDYGRRPDMCISEFNH